MQATAGQQAIPFFLNPRNQDFFYGRIKYLAPSWSDRYLKGLKLVGWVTLILCALFLAPIVLIFISVPGIFILDKLVMVSGFIVIIVPLLVRIIGYRLFILLCIFGSRGLSTKGRILMGTLAHTEGIDIRNNQGFSVNYEIRVQFIIETAPGRTFSGSDSAIRNDLRHSNLLSFSYMPLPQPGTPVAVLYVDDSNYRML